MHIDVSMQGRQLHIILSNCMCYLSEIFMNIRKQIKLQNFSVASYSYHTHADAKKSSYHFLDMYMQVCWCLQV